MNLFKALSNGHGTISETNITSFLSYLLNQTSELRLSFSVLLLEELNHKLDDWLFTHLDLKNLSTREKIQMIERSYFISCDPEVRITSSKGPRIIDSVMTISNKNSERDELYILIENKVSSGAKNIPQCFDQYNAFKECEDYDSTVPVISVLITNDTRSFQSSIDKVLSVNPHSVWLKWVSRDIEEKTIFNLVQDVLTLEHQGSIPPINIETQSSLKYFNDFIWAELYPHSSTKRQSTINGVEQVDMIEVSIDEKQEYLDRYENNMIRFLNSEYEVVREAVLPKLRYLNDHLGLDISLTTNSGVLKNTQTIGKEVINRVKERTL